MNKQHYAVTQEYADDDKLSGNNFDIFILRGINMIKRFTSLFMVILCVLAVNMISALTLPDTAHGATSTDYQATPPFVTAAGVPPLLMLSMGRDHKLYYEAYNDASDLNNDGILDVRYNPEIDYYGYFDSYKCYRYNSASTRFEPSSKTTDKTINAAGEWSGDFLNYLTMTRMDCLRKVLYGGYRSTDTATETVLERTFIPQDAHSWGKEYKSISNDGYDIRKYADLELPKGASRHLFTSTTLVSSISPPLLRVLENTVFRAWEWVAIERPVAGAQGDDGTGRRAITNNNLTTGDFVDVTNGGTAGVADDSYTGSGSVTFADDFDDNSIDSSWQWVDKDGGADTSRAEIGGEMKIKARGQDVWTGVDQFAALYQDDVSGDFEFEVQITSQQNTNPWAKCGIMVRNDMTQAGSATGYCVMSLTPGNGCAFQWDADANGFLEGYVKGGSGIVPPVAWVKLTKVGTTFTGYYGTDGNSWTFLKSVTLPSASTVQDVGLFVSSHNSSKLCKVRFDNVTFVSGTEPKPENAFDDVATTEWIYPDEPSVGNYPWIEFNFSTSVEIKAYTINAGNDAPKSWELIGSLDQSTWDTLDTESNGNLTPGTLKTFTCDTSSIYKYYRLVITSSTGAAAGFSIKEIEMMETTEPTPATATLTDYSVRVKVCDPIVGIEPNSKQYPGGNYKPVGILQRYGEADRMYFGLMTGSYAKNSSGGVLRKNISSIRNEINADTGEFKYKDSAAVNGIIKTIDGFKVKGFDYGSYSYNENCGWVTTRPINQGECRLWGNPIGEIMYESLRYFSGANTPTSEFLYSGTTDDNTLGLPLETWLDPYTNGEDLNQNGSLDAGEDINGNGVLDGFDYCSRAFMLVLSDIYPSYDSNQLPGNAFSGTVSSSLGTLNVQDLAGDIWALEGDTLDHFIGQSAATYNGACSAKSIAGFENIRGLCPGEPTKEGSYYSAAVAYYGNKTDLHASAIGDQKVGTYCVGLSSPYPDIKINVGGKDITLVPFGKSVGGASISAAQGAFQPTNSIVDFFVQEISPVYGKFRINFEDVEQGADHDMDAIVEYTYQVLDSSDNPIIDPANAADGVKVRVTLNSTYAAGSIMQHMGYIVSGSTHDGTYLEVRDKDTAAGSDPQYFLDTPPGQLPGGTWNDGTALPLTATRDFTPSSSQAATMLTNPLWYAAKWGGFEDFDGSGEPDQVNEWDKDNDGDPDTYFFVQNPLDLEKSLNKAFADILRRTSSGTAASVISQTRSGEGAVYQAVFFPEYKDTMGYTISWAGDVHALFVDSYGNMREDTDQNRKLDLIVDRIVVFNDAVVEKYEDTDGDSSIPAGQTPVFTGVINDVKFLWNSTNWLNEMADNAAISQRVNYTDTTSNRYIFTFIDKNENMIADSGEQVDFACPSLPSETDLKDINKIYPYINLFPTFADEPSIMVNSVDVPLDVLRSSQVDLFKGLLVNQTRRVIDYIRGVDQGELTIPANATSPSYTIPAFRSRQTDYDADGTMETWRLGDIVYSTPTLVGRPSEVNHLLYKDKSYGVFASKFKDRRQVVYVGGNDGMLHAFNGGFYDGASKEFKLTGTNSLEAQHALGVELWAYVPYNLLPHLSWLTEPSYSHVYYCDLSPKVFDAKILPDGTHYTDTDGQPNWGTFLICGMRLGGGEIVADMDKTNGNTVKAIDRTMTSAYFILDITDPGLPPKVIAELSLPDLGYTTCTPAVIPMKDKDPITGSIGTENGWYLVLGSGPAEADGKAGIYDSLRQAKSGQSAKLYVVDLKALTGLGGAPAVDIKLSESLDGNSFISDPITVDFDLDYSADAVYFGTESWDSTNGWGGKLRRIKIDNALDTTAWVGDSILMDVGQPITAAPSVGIDDRGKKWVYFGTGRFFVNVDKTMSDQQSYYGVIEPFHETPPANGYMDNTESLKWIPVVKTELLDVSLAAVYEDKTVNNVSGFDTWEELMATIDDTGGNNGWFLDFPLNTERNLGQATLLGELLTFTTYIPSPDICAFGGESNLYAFYYKTGTAYFMDVMGSTDDNGVKKMTKTISLGNGLTVTPNLHVGEEEGSKVFIQTSTGDIKVIQQINPAATKSGIRSWREME